MAIARPLLSRWSKTPLVCVAILALLARILVPAGWMPARLSDGFAITLCTGQGAVVAWVDGADNRLTHSPDDQKRPDPSGAPCAFAALSTQAHLPPAAALSSFLPAWRAAILPVRAEAPPGPLSGARPPPATGPPALI